MINEKVSCLADLFYNKYVNKPKLHITIYNNFLRFLVIPQYRSLRSFFLYLIILIAKNIDKTINPIQILLTVSIILNLRTTINDNIFNRTPFELISYTIQITLYKSR